MEFRDYFRILRQRGWMIIVLAVLTAGATYVYSDMQPRVYESTLRLLVIPSRTDFGQAQAAKTLMRGYTQWMNSSLRAGVVINTLQLDMNPDDLLGKVGIASDDSSFIITLEVEDTSEQQANDIARTWGNLVIQWQEENNAKLRKEDRIGIEFVDNPKIALKSPRMRINTIAGGVMGALVGLILIFILEWVDSGILRRSEDIERYLEVPVVGTIPKS
ncbi:MAG: Wzz/FepE/Etk N-terminal domain-containing protein [Ardenticatenaceae bacterium]|nr:Wzz/FepE/Etk N-terminal domain-containing protein [Ardenticatenaceae bacterium]